MSIFLFFYRKTYALQVTTADVFLNRLDALLYASRLLRRQWLPSHKYHYAGYIRGQSFNFGRLANYRGHTGRETNVVVTGHTDDRNQTVTIVCRVKKGLALLYLALDLLLIILLFIPGDVPLSMWALFGLGPYAFQLARYYYELDIIKTLIEQLSRPDQTSPVPL